MAKEQLPVPSVTRLPLTQATRILTPGTGVAVTESSTRKRMEALLVSAGAAGAAEVAGAAELAGLFAESPDLGRGLGRGAVARRPEKGQGQNGRAGGMAQDLFGMHRRRKPAG